MRLCSLWLVLRWRTWWEAGGPSEEASSITQFPLSLPTVTPNLTGKFCYLLAASHTLFEALYINEVTKLYPIFLLPISMSESILDQLCPKNLICGCPRTFNTELLMYYGSGSNNMIAWIHFSMDYIPSTFTPPSYWNCRSLHDFWAETGTGTRLSKCDGTSALQVLDSSQAHYDDKSQLS